MKHRNQVLTSLLPWLTGYVAITLKAHNEVSGQAGQNLIAARHALHVGLYVRPCLLQTGLTAGADGLTTI